MANISCEDYGGSGLSGFVAKRPHQNKEKLKFSLTMLCRVIVNDLPTLVTQCGAL